MRDRYDVGPFDVSRETFERLEVFEKTILKWNPKINLVSKSSLKDLWARHIVDSIQVFRCVAPGDHWVDIGSGGGFPGMIAAIVGQNESPGTRFTLIESDQRKCAFLRTAARECGVTCSVLSQRIEAAEPQSASVLSARALADLSILLSFGARHLKKDGTAVFPKGATWKKELQDAQQAWRFEVESLKSHTEQEAAVLKIRSIMRE
ncbi:MAG: 16S rRNA (guanine(527)-N(7))-methyltransferase RsmG [Paracoccaceae bacterium]